MMLSINIPFGIIGLLGVLLSMFAVSIIGKKSKASLYAKY